MFFDRAGTYQASLFEKKLTPSRLSAFQKTASLSRYVGVIRWSGPGGEAIDTIWDTTDTMRDTAIAEQLLGVVALSKGQEDLAEYLEQILLRISRR